MKLLVLSTAIVLVALCMLLSSAAHAAQNPNVVMIDTSKQSKIVPTLLPGFGGRSPNGHEIGVNSQYLTLDGKPWLPVMGEFHYSRYPEQYWEEELLKMKAGGIQIVSTYVFWIHHEEIQGQFDWTGQRNLRSFVELCSRHGLYVFIRIGPYAHGEVRNGGLPDWVLSAGATRKNDPQYLSYVHTYFAQIARQVNGFFWKDGGPIIGVQLENEYSKQGADAGASHISELKKMARAAGLDAPIYTVTGWDNAVYPAGEVIPVFGGYVDNFWESTLDDLPPAGYYLFETLRSLNGTKTPNDAEPISYPFFMAEAGGGMQVAYHRRPVIDGDDVAAMTLTRLGSGVNLYGYYMFQGGANPDGNRTSLQEAIDSDHVYDLPQISYDFQAPLGQFGQMNPAFRATKPFHLFLNDFGGYLATMTSVLPQIVPAGATDRLTVRAAARVQGNHGFVFINNYQRLYPLPDHHNVQVRLALPAETLLLPRKPVDIPQNAYAIWPVNLDLNGVLLKYATAQLLTKVSAESQDYYFFFTQPGIPAEFAFDEHTVSSLSEHRASITHAGDRIYACDVAAGPRVTLTAQSKYGRNVHIIVLTLEEARNAWTLSVAGQEYLVLSPADVFSDRGTLHLRARDTQKLAFSIFPHLKSAPSANVALKPPADDGLFATYSAVVPPKEVNARWEKVRDAAPSTPVRMGQYNAAAPHDADFERAGLWRITLPDHAMDGLSDIFLRVHYAGDVARLYLGRRLLDDDFYKGTPWEIGLKRFFPDAARQSLTLRIMPLRKDAPIYIQRRLRPQFPASGETATVTSIECQPEYEARVTLH